MQEWNKFSVLVTSAAAALAASAALAQTGAVPENRVAEHTAVIPNPVLIEPAPPEINILPDGSVEVLPTSIVTRYICGSDVTGKTVADLERIKAIAAAAEAEQKHTQVVTGAGLRGGLNITFNITAGSPPAAAIARLSDIATYYNSTLSDPVSVTISFQWVNLGGGALGATSSVSTNLVYSSVRNLLVSDMDADDVIQDFLPDTTAVGVVFDATAGTVVNQSIIRVNHGNRKGLGQTPPGISATIIIDSIGTPWDFDESNGVSGSAFGFESVVVHEVAHMLGFTSAVDTVGDDMELMDLYRFNLLNVGSGFNPSTFHEFEAGPRLADTNNPDDRHNTDLITVVYRMEDGSPNQASHFRFNVGGVMEAGIAPGQSFWPDFLQISDLHVLDSIGWDVITGPCTTLGDVDVDGDVDLRDVQLFQECFSPGSPTAAGCECADVAHRDDQVNLLDWEVMERSLMTGP